MKEPFPLGVNVRIRPGKLRNCGSENCIQGNSSTLASAEEFASGEYILHQVLQETLTDLASSTNSSMLHAMSTPSLYIYIFFVFVCEREELEQPVGKRGSQLWTYRGALKKFLKAKEAKV
ncbi:hypothetical protein P8452_66993 [Trifolium repens]|nr:hypothetical protein P8452_66993 [Trifolium repens]